jgi:PST family polysaccharide transporter
MRRRLITRNTTEEDHPAQQFRRGAAVVGWNFMSLASLDIFNYLLPLITFPYLLRLLGAEEYGIIAFATSFVQYFTTITDYGFTISAAREVAVVRHDRQRLSEVVTAILLIKACLLLACGLIAAVIVSASPPLRAVWNIELFGFGLVAANALSLTWFFQGMEQMRYITALGLCSKCCYTILVFAVIHHQQDYYLVPLLGSAAEITVGVLGVILAIRQFGIRVTAFSAKEWRIQLHHGFHAFISYVTMSCYSSTRTFVLGLLAGPKITGYYAIAERIGTVMQGFPLHAFIAAAYPRLCTMYERDPAGSYHLTMRLQRYATWLYAASVPVCWVLAPFIVQVAAGSVYGITVWVLRLLVVANFFWNANLFRLRFLLVSGRYSTYSRVYIATSVVGSVTDLIGACLVSYWGPPVAAILLNAAILARSISLVRNPREELTRPEEALANGRVIAKA